MNICFVYASDRQSEALRLLADLRQHGVSEIPCITSTSTSEARQRQYQDAQALGIMPSPGLRDDPHLKALVHRATGDAESGRKTVFPIVFSQERGIFPALEKYAGVYLFGGAKVEERQVQKLLRWLQ